MILWSVLLQNSIYATAEITAVSQSPIIAGWVNVTLTIAGIAQNFPELSIAIKENETLTTTDILRRVLKLLSPEKLTFYKGILTYVDGRLIDSISWEDIRVTQNVVLNFCLTEEALQQPTE